MLPPKPSESPLGGENPSLLLPASDSAIDYWAPGCTVAVFVSILTWPSPLLSMASPLLSFISIIATGFKAYLFNPGMIAS